MSQHNTFKSTVVIYLLSMSNVTRLALFEKSRQQFFVAQIFGNILGYLENVTIK